MKTSRRRSGAKEYEDYGYDLAVKLLIDLGVRLGACMTGDDIRDHLDTLDDAQLLQTTVGDFWLGVTKDEGKERRKFDPIPPNPFKHKQHRSRLGRKDEIEAWDGHWRTIEAAAVYAKSGVRRIRNIGMALRKSLPWLEHEVDGIIGALNDLTRHSFAQAMQADISALAIKQYTVADALRRRWHDTQERAIWIKRLELAHRHEERELRLLASQEIVNKETLKLDQPRPVAPKSKF